MFNVGDKAVHPAYGAGTVIDIKEKQIGDEHHTYYVIELFSQAGTLMVPISRADDVGLRRPIEKPQHVLQVLASNPETLSDDHRKRQESLGVDIRSGNVLKITEAVRDMAHRERVGKLTEADLRLYRKAQEFLLGELALSQDIDLEKARDQLEAVLNNLKDDIDT